MFECVKRQGPDCVPIVDKAIIVTPSSLVKVAWVFFLSSHNFYLIQDFIDSIYFLHAHLDAELAERDREVAGWSASDSRSGQRRQGDHREGTRYNYNLHIAHSIFLSDVQ